MQTRCPAWTNRLPIGLHHRQKDRLCCLSLGNNNIIDFTPLTCSTICIRHAALSRINVHSQVHKGHWDNESPPANQPWNHMHQATVPTATVHTTCLVTMSTFRYMVYNSFSPSTTSISSSIREFLANCSATTCSPSHSSMRVLVKIIGDDAFAIPFWKWDAPDY